MAIITPAWKRALDLAASGDQESATELFESSYPTLVANDEPVSGTVGLPPWRVAIMQAAGPVGMTAAIATMRTNYPQLFAKGSGRRPALRRRHRRARIKGHSRRGRRQ